MFHEEIPRASLFKLQEIEAFLPCSIKNEATQKENNWNPLNVNLIFPTFHRKSYFILIYILRSTIYFLLCWRNVYICMHIYIMRRTIFFSTPTKNISESENKLRFHEEKKNETSTFYTAVWFNNRFTQFLIWTVLYWFKCVLFERLMNMTQELLYCGKQWKISKNIIT